MPKVAMGSTKYEVELFDGENNFVLWQSTIRDLLTMEGLDVVFEDTKPAGIQNANGVSMQKSATSLIRLALTPEAKYNVLGELTPKGIWDKLEELYASKSLTNRLLLKLDLYSLKMEEGTSVHKHLLEFNRLKAQVISIGEKIGDEEQALLLFRLCPNR